MNNGVDPIDTNGWAYNLGESASTTAQMITPAGVGKALAKEAAEQILKEGAERLLKEGSEQAAKEGVEQAAKGVTKGLGGRVLSAAERAEFDAFAARARAQGLVENPYRTGSWGKMENGKFVEHVRVDVGEAGKPGWRGQTHIHIEGQNGHLDPITKIPGEQ